MSDLENILPLWRDLRRSGTEYVLATVVAVEGSGYRKPGAQMLVAADGRRAGTISGGCLEAEVARRALWHTEHGPVLRRYSTSADDGEVPFGMGCGGVVHLLLERSTTASGFLERLADEFAERNAMAVATVLEGDWIGQRAYWPNLPDDRATDFPALTAKLSELAEQCFEQQRSFSQTVQSEGGQVVSVSLQWRPARTGLFVFGAGDDAIPVVKLARQLGWHVSVADGRSNLATQARFPDAQEVHVLGAGEWPAFATKPTDAAVVMTHSLEQDTRILGELLKEDLAYLGVLGPRHRTAEVLLAVANVLSVPASRVDAQLMEWMDRLHAPMGLDLGGDTPADIALAAVAEVQQTLRRATGLSLRAVRGGLTIASLR
jgi:xanthine/CO dehydrogenase XdhC/CoxF family maturation factor